MAIIPSAALVFDLDDTLFPERDFVLSGFQAVGDWLETNLSLLCIPTRSDAPIGNPARSHIAP